MVTSLGELLRSWPWHGTQIDQPLPRTGLLLSQTLTYSADLFKVVKNFNHKVYKRTKYAATKHNFNCLGKLSATIGGVADTRSCTSVVVMSLFMFIKRVLYS